ncbi:MAG TPA: VOC family protein [Phycisphaerales bacterium]|nr:VOC family protein [Phycisphaerales bacterium]
MLNRPCHFEIHSTDPEKSLAFFKDVFGWSVHKWESPTQEYWLLGTGDCCGPEAGKQPGINGGLMRSRDGKDRTVNTIQVDDVHRVLKAVEAAGGKVVVPTMAIPGVGWLAYCKTPRGIFLV